MGVRTRECCYGGCGAGKRTLSTFRAPYNTRCSCHRCQSACAVCPCARAYPVLFFRRPCGFADCTHTYTRAHTHITRRLARTLSWVEPYGRVVTVPADEIGKRSRKFSSARPRFPVSPRRGGALESLTDFSEQYRFGGPRNPHDSRCC